MRKNEWREEDIQQRVKPFPFLLQTKTLEQYFHLRVKSMEKEPHTQY
jgi:hypothetical protein